MPFVVPCAYRKLIFKPGMVGNLNEGYSGIYETARDWYLHETRRGETERLKVSPVEGELICTYVEHRINQSHEVCHPLITTTICADPTSKTQAWTTY